MIEDKYYLHVLIISQIDIKEKGLPNGKPFSFYGF
jgi:hypothetical protein